MPFMIPNKLKFADVVRGYWIPLDRQGLRIKNVTYWYLWRNILKRECFFSMISNGYQVKCVDLVG